MEQNFSTKKKFIPGRTAVPLAIPSFGSEEVTDALEVMLSGKVTMGERVRQFEGVFAKYVGVRHGIMVNSGSSANLVALTMLSNPERRDRIQPGDEIITPAVTWATTVFPICNVGAVPVLVDVQRSSFNLDPSLIESAITPRTKAIMLVHLLGTPCDMAKIMKIAKNHGLLVIEDSCEAHGAEFEGRKVGSFADASTFSFYLSHHITTIEGGMVMVNSDEDADIARAIRAHGWVREMQHKERHTKRISGIDERFLFVTPGYNLRPMEIQGAFGVRQLPKLEGFIRDRQSNAEYFSAFLRRYGDLFDIPELAFKGRQVWFGYPLSIGPGAGFSLAELRTYLENKHIETRPIMAGNFAEQPVIHQIRHRIHRSLPVSEQVARNSLFIGVHQGIGKIEREYVIETIRRFVEEYS